MFSLWDVLEHQSGPIKIVDVGAMAIGTGQPDYHALLKPGVSKLIGFEPNEQECRKLNQSCNDDCSFLPYFIGDGRTRTFNLCSYSATSSLYEPDISLLEKFQNMAELHQILESCDIVTRRLDDICEVQEADYLKIDVQGAEVDVFKGAENLLSEIMVIHTEVEFIPLYKDQPLFADVDTILRKNGFLFHRFNKHAMAGRRFKPIIVKNNVNIPLSQVLWADAIYVKNFMHLDQMSPGKLLKLAVILHDVYESHDFVYYVLSEYDKQTSSECAEGYLEILNNGANAGTANPV